MFDDRGINEELAWAEPARPRRQLSRGDITVGCRRAQSFGEIARVGVDGV
jgi:hypothetical protein